MTVFLCITSFVAGYLICWATTRHAVRNAERRAALAHAWQGGCVETAIRRGQGAL